MNTYWTKAMLKCESSC